jgi:D-alanyl-D-alanine carboxypeptidase/D-alanyl-D-alanine-endopeptidase (penicillin-binding protein 4)
VRIGGRVRVGSVPRKLRGRPPLGRYKSPTIAALAAATNKVSNNFYAEMLLKGTWAAKGHLGTTRGGVGVVERYARSLGSRVSAKDGSGLTDRNLSSPRDVVRLLVAIRRQRQVGRPLFNSRAIAGKDGTLDERMEGTVAAGRCRGKTVTIDGVSNLSGYCKSCRGLVAFSLLMNGVGDYDYARSIQDRMVVEIARYRP